MIEKPKGSGCRYYTTWFKEWTDLSSRFVHGKRRERKRHRLVMAFKGCKKIFDRPCKVCDGALKEEAIKEWIGKMSKGHEPMLPEHQYDLETNIRKLLNGWDKRLIDGIDLRLTSDDIMNPGREGCREVCSSSGGTLSSDSIFTRGYADNYVRLGAAKTKGKFRVVTMQTAYVKRVLKPIHTALYDFISRQSWCVRGNVKKEHFDAVCESACPTFISGDYESATDNIKKEAVELIVRVLSESKGLSPQERDTLVSSFRNLHFTSCIYGTRPIKRGSMMGNLMSFPILCLLNKACHMISQKERGWRSRVNEGLFNGDDCVFPGDRKMYQIWREVTSRYGLVVNEGKTMLSSRFLELNSQVYDRLCGERVKMISKINLSFLRPSTQNPGEILGPTLRGIRSLKHSLQLWIVNSLMRYEISLRGFALSSIPAFWQKELPKRRWFRNAFYGGPAPLKASGVEGEHSKTRVTDPKGLVMRNRKGKIVPVEDKEYLPYSARDIPVAMGPPPKDRYLKTCEDLIHLVEQDYLKGWIGKLCTPISYTFDRSYFRRKVFGKGENPPTRFIGFRQTWLFLWPRILFDQIENYPEILDFNNRTSSRLFSKRLHLSYTCTVDRKPIYYPTPPPDAFPKSYKECYM